MSSFGVEEFRCVQRCPHFRVWNRVVPLHIYRGVLISGVWNRRVPLCTEVSHFGIEEFHCVQRCLILGVWNRGNTEVSSFQGI